MAGVLGGLCLIVDSLRTIILKRLAFGLLTLFVISVLITLGVEMLPGDLAQALLGQQATQESLAAIRLELGLDRPLHVRYFDWLGKFVQWDLGTSLANGREVADLIGKRLSNTLFLAVTAEEQAQHRAICCRRPAQRLLRYLEYYGQDMLMV